MSHLSTPTASLKSAKETFAALTRLRRTPRARLHVLLAFVALPILCMGLLPTSASAQSQLDDPVVTVQPTASGELTVRWDPVDGAGPGEGFYDLRYREKDTTISWFPTNDAVTQINPATSPQKITGLTNGKTYEVRVHARSDTQGISRGTSNVAEGTPVASPRLDPPVLMELDLGDGEVTARWDDVPFADFYDVLYRQKRTPNTWFTTTNNDEIIPAIRIRPATSPQVITGLTNGTTYEVRVSARSNTQGISRGTSNVVEGAPGPLPTAITNLQLAPKDGSIEVSWTAATVAPNGYIIQWRQRGAGNPLSPINTVDGTSFTITGLTNGLQYLVRVQTRNRANTDVQTDTLVTGIDIPRANTAPTVANPIPDQSVVGATLSYTFPANTFSDEQDSTLTYTASKADDTALPSWLTFDASTRTFSGPVGAAEVGTIVSVKVTASDTEGGSVSDEFDISLTKGSLAAPTGLAAKPDSRTSIGFAVTWTAVPNAAGYTATATPSGGSAIDGTVVTTGTNPEAFFTGLTADTSYAIAVKATGNIYYNDSGTASLNVSTTSASVTPTKASNLQVVAADRSLNVSWTAATAAPTGYSVRWRPTGPTTLTEINTVFGTSFIIPDLTPGIGYLVRLETRNFANTGLQANTEVTTTAVTPFGAAYTAPTTLSVGTSVTVSPVVEFGSDTPSYAVTTGTLPPGLTLNTATGVISGTPTTVSSSPTTVTITATAGSGSTQKTSTPEITFPVVDKGALAAPSDLLEKPGTNSRTGFTMTWTAVPNAAGYTATATPSGGTAINGVVTITNTGPEASFTGLTGGTSYLVSVTATGDDNYANSAATSLTVTTSTLVVPTEASNLQVTAADRSLSVSWTAADEAPNGYSVRWRETGQDKTFSAINTVVGTSFIILDLTPGTGYLVRLETRNAANDDVQSGTAITTPVGITPFGVAYTAPPTLRVGTAVTPLNPVIGGFGTDTPSYAVTTGTLPDGLGLDTATGVISGAPTTASISTTTVTITATTGSGSTQKVATSDIIFPVIGRSTLANPMGLAVKSNTLSQVGFTMTWMAVENAEGYEATATQLDSNGIETGTPTEGTVDTTGAAPEAFFNGLSASTTYLVKVKATGNANYSDSAAAELPVTTSVSAVPTKVSGLQVAAADRSLSVSWTAATVAPNGYSVRWRPTGQGTTLTEANTVLGTSFIIPDLTPGTTYLVRVETRNVANTGVQENTDVNFSTGAAPFGVTYTAPATLNVGASVTVSPVRGGFGSDTPSYKVTTGTLPPGLTLNTASGVISGAPTAVSSSPTTVTITATAGSGSTQKVSTPDITFPAVGKGVLPAPPNLSVKSDTTSRTGFTVTWTADALASGYTATATQLDSNDSPVGTPIDGTVTEPSTGPEASFTGLTAGTTYRVSVTALGNANYLNSPAATLSVTTQAPPVPTRASNLQVVPADRSLSVSWTAATEAPNGYSVRWRVDEVGTTLSPIEIVTTTTFTNISNLIPGTAYVVQVDTRNIANTGVQENTEVTSTGVEPFGAIYTAPTKLSMDTSVTVTPVSGGFGSDAPSYAVTTGTLPPGLNLNAATGVISGAPTTLNSSTTTVTITVTAGSGSTQKTSIVNLTFPAVVVGNAMPVITDIADQTATFGTDLEVDVDAADTDTGDTLQYKAESSDATVATVTPTTLTNLAANSKVTVTPVAAGTATITVTVSDGAAMPTDTFMVTVSRAQLGTPVVTLVAGDGQLTPNWAAVAGASSYDLQWKRSSVTSWSATSGVTTVESTTSGTAITGLTNGEAYDVRVRANAASSSTTYTDGDWSSGTQGTPNRTLSMRLREKSATNVVFDDGGRPTGDAAWEDARTVEFDVTLSSAISAGDAAVTVDYATSDIPDTDPAINLVREIYPAVAGQDYTAVSGTLTFAAGDTTKVITVRIPDDTTYEPRQQVFRIELSNPVGTSIPPGQGTLDLSIVDDDPFPPVTVTATGLTSTGSPGATATDAEGRLRVVEGDSGLTSVIFTVSQPIVVGWRNILAGDLFLKTDLGTATAGTDFPNIRARTFSFDRGLTQRNFIVSITGDTATEDDETLYIEFSRARPDSIVSNADDNAFLIEITIVDDDGVPSAPSAPSLTMTASGQLTANWMAPVDDGGSGITDYDVRYRVKPTSGDPAWTPLDDTGVNAAGMRTTTTIGGLTNGTMYQVQVRAQNRNGEGAWSTSAEGTPSASNLVPTFGTMTIDDQIWVVDTNTSLTLPAATGGNGTLSYTLSPSALPAGITFNAPTRTLSGTPTVVASAATYTYTVADGDTNTAASDTASLTFSLAVGNGRLAMPTGLTQKPDSLSPNQFTIIWNAVANASGYAATAVQSGKSFIGAVTTSSSRPEATFIGLDSNATYAVTVVAKGNANYQDSMGATLTVITPSFSSDAAPDFGAETIADQIWVVGTRVNLTLPTATSGNEGLSYTLSPNTPPAGVAFDVTTRRLSGIPTAVASAATYTWTAADGDSNTAASDTTSLTFSVTVNKGTLVTPTGLALKASTQTQTGFTVAWDAVAGATSYTATATPSGGTAVTGTVDTSGTKPEAVFTGLTADTAYTVSVVAKGNTANYNDSAAGTAILSTAAGSVTPALVFTPTALTVGEGASGTYTVALATQPTASVTVAVNVFGSSDVTVDTDGGTTGDQSDLTFTSSTWNTAQTVTVSAAEDNDVGDDTATLSHAALGGGYGSVTGSVSVTVDDDDTRGVTISETALTVLEGASGTYTVVLDTQPTGDVTVTIGGASGDVSVDTDGGTTGNQNTLTFTSSTWNTAQTVTVTAAEDEDAAADAAVTLTHAVSGGDYGLVTAASVVVTITEKDAATFSVTGPSDVAEGAGTATYTVSLSAQPSAGVSVAYATSDGTATAGSDYTAASGSRIFTTDNWDTAQTVNVTITDDTVDENDETFTFTLTESSTGTSLSASPTVTTTITDNDVPAVTVSFGAATYSVTEGGTVSVTVTLSADPERSVTIPLTTTNGTGAVAGDYSGVPASVAFASGETSKTLTFSATDDSVDESDETVTLSFGASLPTRVTAGTTSSTVVTITDNDTSGLTYSAAPSTLTVGTPITALTATATGFGSATVAYSVTSTVKLPAGLNLSTSTGAITGAPTTASTSTATVTVSATSGSGDTARTATVNITFPAVGKGTLATPTGLALKTNTQTQIGFTVTWTAVTNATGYTATAVQGSNTFTGTVDTTGTNPEATFTGLAANTTYAVSVVATGNTANYENSAAATLSQATAANSAPTANAGADTTVAEGASVTLDGTGSSDPDAGTTLTYSWARKSGETNNAVTLTNANTASASFTAPNDIAANVTLTFVLTVSDGTLSATDEVVITVTGNNAAATFSGDLTGAVTEDAIQTTATGTVTVTDSDGANTVQAQSNVEGTYGTLSIATSGAWTYTLDNTRTATNALAAGATPTDAFPIQSADNTPGTVTITVTGANDAPTANAGADTTVTEGVSVTLSGAGNDPDAGTTLTYSWARKSGETDNAVTLTNANTASASFTAPDDIAANATLTFVLTVSDGTLSATDEVVITVTGANADATFSGDLAGAVTEDATETTATGTVTVTDNDGANMVQAQTDAAGTYGTLTIATSGAWTYTLDNADADTNALAAAATATDAFTINAADGTAGTVTITVTGANDAPTANAGADTTVAEGASVTLDGTGSSDPDAGTTLTYSWARKSGETNNAVTLTNANTASASFTAPDDIAANATLTFVLTVSDGTLSATDEVVITVTGANADATFSGDLAGAVTEDATETTATGTVTVTDNDGANMVQAQTDAAGTYGTLTIATSGAWTYTLDNADADTNALAAAATATDAFTINAADGTAGTVTITVTGANDAPTADAGANATVTEGVSVTLSGTDSSDPDAGTTLTYSWARKSGETDNAVTLTNANTASASFTAPDDIAANATLTFVLTVSDGTLSATDEVVITVTGANADATFSGDLAGAVTEDATETTATGTVTVTDNDGANTVQAQTDAAGTYGTLTIATSGAWTYTLDNADADTNALAAAATATDAFEIAAADGTEGTVTITVTGANDAPTANAGADTTVAEGASVTLSGTGSSDPDAGTTLTYSWARKSGETNNAVTLTNANTASASFTAPNDIAANVTLTFVLTVSDGTLSATDEVVITVTGANAAATFSGDLTGAVTEDATQTTATGTVTVTDNDGANTVQAQSNVEGTYGTLSIATSGAWTYTLDNTRTATNALAAGATPTDAFPIQSADNTPGTVTITVTGANDAPTANAGADTTVTEGVSVTLSGAGNDPDAGTTLTYSWARKSGETDNAVTLTNANTASASFTAPDDIAANVTLTFVLTVSDGTLSATDEVVITVTGANATATFGGDLTGAVTEDATETTATGTVTVTDNDGANTVQAQTNAAGTYGTLTIATSGAWTYTLDNTRTATNALAAGATPTDTFPIQSADNTPGTVTITVTGANDAPTANAGADTTVTEGVSVTLSGAGNDPDAGTTLTYSWARKSGETDNAVTLTNANTASASFTAPNDIAANVTLTFVLTVSDGTLSATDEVVITVTGNNAAATFSGDLTGAVTEDATQTTATGTVTVTDNDGANMVQAQTDAAGTYGTLTIATSGAWTYTLDNADADTNALAAAATATDAFTINAADGTAGTVTITVTGANDAPTVANAIADQTATVGVAFSYVFPANSFSDADSGNTLTYTASKSDDMALPTWLSFSAGTRTFSGTPQSTDAGTLSVKVTASDGTASVSDTFDIEVSLVPALVFTPTALTVDEGGSGTYTVALATQPTATVTVTVAGSGDVSVSPTSLTFSNSNWDTAQTVTVSAAEDDDDAIDDSVTLGHTTTGYGSVSGNLVVTVDDDDQSLTYTAAPTTMTVGTPITALTATATNFTGTLGYSVTTGSLPAGLEISSSTGAIAGTPMAASTSTTTVTVTATAGTGTDAQTATANITFPAVSKATLATPTGLALKANTQTQTGFTVTWTAVANATGYTATATPSGGTAVTGTVDTTGTNPEAAFTGLTAGTTYTVSVVATGNTANYENSSAATLSQATAEADVAPSFGNETIADQTWMVGTPVNLTLPAATDGNGTLSYTLSPDLPTGVTLDATTRVVSGTPTVVASAVTYTWSAADGDTNTADTDTVSLAFAVTVEAPLQPDPTRVSDLQVTAGDGSLEVSWTAASEAPNGYSVRWREKGPGTVLTPANEVTGTTFTIPDLTNGVTYVVRVETRNVANDGVQPTTFVTGTGTPVAEVVLVMLDTPVVTVRAGDGQLTANWADVANAAEYELQWKPSTVASWDDTGVSSVYPATSGTRISGLTNNEAYGVRVRARAADGSMTHTDSLWSSVAQGRPVADERSRSRFSQVPRVSIADAEPVAEGQNLIFQVTLSRAVRYRVKVYWATRPGTATANRDYKSAAGAVVFRPGVTQRRIRVKTLNDAHDDPNETMKVRLSSPRGVLIADGVATGMIINSDAMPTAWLARFGRTVTEQALEGVGQRLTAPREAGTEANLAGLTLLDSAGGKANAWASAGQVSGEMSGVPAGLPVGGVFNSTPLDGSPASGAGRALFSGGSMSGMFGGSAQGGGALGGGFVGSAASAARGSAPFGGNALTRSSFTQTGAMDEDGGSLAFWGRGAQSVFRGMDGSMSLDGEVETATLGVDYAREQWLAGVALAYSQGAGGYRESEAGLGDVKTTLSAAIPYASYRFSERLDVWGAVGRGVGTLTLTPQDEGGIETDLDWSMVSAGLRGGLLGAEGRGAAVSVVSDAFWSRTGSARMEAGMEAGERHSSLAASQADVSRLRLGLEGSWALDLGRAGGLMPKLEAGVRHDGGDAEQGFGVEVGGGVAWRVPALGLTLDVSGRTLLTHEDDGQEAYGFSAALGYDPRPETTRGFTLNLRQDVGGPSSGGVQALFVSELPGVGMGSGASLGSRWNLETSYGMAVSDDRFTLSPSFGLGVSETAIDYSLGWELVPQPSETALDFTLTLKATRREPLDVGSASSTWFDTGVGGDGVGSGFDTGQQNGSELGPEHGVSIGVTARW